MAKKNTPKTTEEAIQQLEKREAASEESGLETPPVEESNRSEVPPAPAKTKVIERTIMFRGHPKVVRTEV